ncbi:thioredoxin [Candidatus Saccharibacteria bacterium]|nr:thioredoxin [Candidatus Saccharibacteria bacterium]
MIIGNKENFSELIGEGVVLVDFNADWCGPCQMMKPVVEEFAKLHGDVKVVSVNVDDEEELSEQYEVSTIPCLVMMKDGAEVAREIGVMPPKKLEKMLEKAA